MIDLVLDGACFEALRAETPFPSFDIQRMNADVNGPSDVHGDLRKRKASLSCSLVALRRRDDRVYENQQSLVGVSCLRMPACVDHHNPCLDSDLRSRQAHATRMSAHGVDEVRDRIPYGFVDAGTRLHRTLEKRVWVTKYRPDGHFDGAIVRRIRPPGRSDRHPVVGRFPSTVKKSIGDRPRPGCRCPGSSCRRHRLGG